LAGGGGRVRGSATAGSRRSDSHARFRRRDVIPNGAAPLALAAHLHRNRNASGAEWSPRKRASQKGRAAHSRGVVPVNERLDRSGVRGNRRPSTDAGRWHGTEAGRNGAASSRVYGRLLNCCRPSVPLPASSFPTSHASAGLGFFNHRDELTANLCNHTMYWNVDG
jgi:hypothetical protein